MHFHCFRVPAAAVRSVFLLRVRRLQHPLCNLQPPTISIPQFPVSLAFVSRVLRPCVRLSRPASLKIVHLCRRELQERERECALHSHSNDAGGHADCCTAIVTTHTKTNILTHSNRVWCVELFAQCDKCNTRAPVSECVVESVVILCCWALWWLWLERFSRRRREFVVLL